MITLTSVYRLNFSPTSKKTTHFQKVSKMVMATVRTFGTVENKKVRNDYISRGLWAEKKPMDTYLFQVLEATQKYVESVELSPDEKRQFQTLKDWYQNGYTPQKSNLLPFIKLKAIGKTFESSGCDYLTKKEVSCYLREGVIGPKKIKNLSGDDLSAITEKFQDFHKNHNRNLGSVCTMLRHKCFLDLATNSTILAQVSSILGDNIMLVNMTVNALPSGHGKSTIETNNRVHDLNCHSDLSSGSQYHFEPGFNTIKNLTLDNRCVNVWVSISGTDPTNAPLYFFPKTHFWDIPTPFTYLEVAKKDPDRILRLLSFKQGSAVRRIGLYNEEYKYLLSSRYKSLLPNIRQTEIYTEPGDAIFFNAHTRHGSGINLSSKTRLAITMRFNTALTEAGGLESAGSVATIAERKELGIFGDNRKPMIQVLGKKHHQNNLPIDIHNLKNLLK